MVRNFGPDVRYVRTMEGARFYGVPIGTPIRAARAAAAERRGKAQGITPPKKALGAPTSAEIERDSIRPPQELDAAPAEGATGRAQGAAVGTVLQDADGIVAWKKTAEDRWEHEAGFTLGDDAVQKFIDSGELQFEDSGDEAEEEIPYAQMTREKFIAALDGKEAGHRLSVDGKTFTKGEDGTWSDGTRSANPQALYFLKDSVADVGEEDSTDDETPDVETTPDVGDSATPEWVNGAKTGAQIQTDAGTIWTKQDDGSWKSESTGSKLTPEQMATAVQAKNAIISRNEGVAEAPDGPVLFPGAEAIDEKTLRAGLEALEKHTGFQILYGFPKGSPLRDKELVGALTTHARGRYPDLSPKEAVKAHLRDILGVEAPEPVADGNDGETITVGSKDPKRIGVQGMNGGQFTRKDIQEAIDILEAFQGKAYKSELNKKGNALGQLDPTSIVGIHKDKTEGKRLFVEHLRGLLADNGGNDSSDTPDPEPAPTPDPEPTPAPETELDVAWYDNATPGTVVEFEYFTGNVSTWTKQDDGSWTNERMPNRRRDSLDMAHDMVGGRLVREGAAPEPEQPPVRTPAQLWGESPETVAELDSLKPGTFIRYLGQYYYRHPDGQWRFANDDTTIGTDSQSFQHTLRGITVVSLPQSSRARIENVLSTKSEYLDVDADLEEEVRPGDTLVLVSADGKQFKQYRRITNVSDDETWLAPDGSLVLTDEIESDFKAFDTVDGDASPYYRVNRLADPPTDPGPGLFTGGGEDIPEPDPAEEPTGPTPGSIVTGDEARDFPDGTRLIYTRKDGRQTAYNVRTLGGNKILVTDKGTEVEFDRARRMKFTVADGEGNAPVPTPSPTPEAPTPEPEPTPTPEPGGLLDGQGVADAPVGTVISFQRFEGQPPVLARKVDEDGRWQTNDPSQPFIVSTALYSIAREGNLSMAPEGTDFTPFDSVDADAVEDLPTGSLLRIGGNNYQRISDGSFLRLGIGTTSSNVAMNLYSVEQLQNEINSTSRGFSILLQRGERDVPAPGEILNTADIVNLPEGARLTMGSSQSFARVQGGFFNLNTGEIESDVTKFVGRNVTTRAVRQEDLPPVFGADELPEEGATLTFEDLLRLPQGAQMEAVFNREFSGPPKIYTFTERFKAKNDITGLDTVGQLWSYQQADPDRRYVFRGMQAIDEVKIGATLTFPSQMDELPVGAILTGPRGEMVRKVAPQRYASLWSASTDFGSVTGPAVLSRFDSLTYVSDAPETRGEPIDPNDVDGAQLIASAPVGAVVTRSSDNTAFTRMPTGLWQGGGNAHIDDEDLIDIHLRDRHGPFFYQATNARAAKGEKVTDAEINGGVKRGTTVVLNVPAELGGADVSGHYVWDPSQGRWKRSRTKTGAALRGRAARRPNVLSKDQMALAALNGNVTKYMEIGEPLPQAEFQARIRASMDVDEITGLMRAQVPSTEILDWAGPAKTAPAHKREMQIETYKDYLIESERLLQTYPMLQGLGMGIGAEDSKKSAFAWAWVNERGVQGSGTRINTRWGLEDMANGVRASRADNWFHGDPKPGLSASMTSATHEFGHIFDSFSGAKLGDVATRALAAYKAEHPGEDVDSKYSNYAKTNKLELVAETFENWHNNVVVEDVTNHIMSEMEAFLRVATGDDDFRFIPNPGYEGGPTYTNAAGRPTTGESRGFTARPAVGDQITYRGLYEAPLGSKIRLKSKDDNRVFTKEENGMWRSEDGFLRPEPAFVADARKKYYWEYVAYFEQAPVVDPEPGAKVNLEDMERAAPGSVVNVAKGTYTKIESGKWVPTGSVGRSSVMDFSSGFMLSSLGLSMTWNVFKKES